MLSTMSQEDSEDEDLNSETDVELDENDNKIIQLYDIINELVDDQGQRVEDLKMLYEDLGEEVLQKVEERHNLLLNQVFSDLQLKEEKDEEEDDDEDDSEDEQDEGWDIYNSMVSNLNEYMGQIALFGEKMQEQKKLIDSYEGPNEDEIKALEDCLERQTDEMSQLIRKNTELETALSSVLQEYSERIESSNKEIMSLHGKLRETNEQHDSSLTQMKSIYETRIKELQKTESSQYKREVGELIDTLTTARADFQNQIVSLTKEMSESQTAHHIEMLRMTENSQQTTRQLQEKTKEVEKLQSKFYNVTSKMKKSLRKTRTELDIDDDDEFYFVSSSSSSSNALPRSNSHSSRNREGPSVTTTQSAIYRNISISSPKHATHHDHGNGSSMSNGINTKKTRTFGPSQYGSNSAVSSSSTSSRGNTTSSSSTSYSTNHSSHSNSKYESSSNHNHKSHDYHRADHHRQQAPPNSKQSSISRGYNPSQRARSHQSRSQSPHSNGHSKYANGSSGSNHAKQYALPSGSSGQKTKSPLMQKYQKVRTTKRPHRSGRK